MILHIFSAFCIIISFYIFSNLFSYKTNTKINLDSSLIDLRNFVSSACENRPDHHGLPHVEKVTHRSLAIAAFNKIQDLKKLRDIIVVSMLHDVNDHKYDPEKKLESKMKIFLSKIYEEKDVDIVMKTISMVSFSKEAKRGLKYYEKELSSYWVDIRNIVSDADKIEAIGIEGIKRCFLYALENKQNNGEEINLSDIIKEIHVHAEEKLLKLFDDYIRTSGGKFFAEPEHKIMKKILEEWNKNPPQTTENVFQILLK